MGTSDSLGTRVVKAIADANKVEPLDLDPLYETIDLEALEKLSANSTADWQIEFSVGDDRVVVDGTGSVTVHDRSTHDRSLDQASGRG